MLGRHALLPSRHDHRPLQHIAHLANVSRPRVLEQALQRIVLELCRRVGEVGAQLLDEVSDELEQIFAPPRSQRGQNHRHDAQAVIQILAEIPGGDFADEVLPRRRNQSHVGGDLARAAQTSEALSFQHAQQLRLKEGIEVSDLVEEEAAAARDVEESRLHRLGRAARRRQLLAKELRVERAPREGGAIDLHHRPLAARARAVDALGDVALSRSALAGDQHRRPLAACEQLDLLGELAHRRRGPEQRRRRQPATPVGEIAVHLPKARLLECAVGGSTEVGKLDRLREKALRSGLHRAHRIRDVAVAGDHNRHAIVLTNPLEHVETADIGKAKVEEDEVGERAPDAHDALLAGVGTHHVVSRALEVRAERRRNRLLVVDDQYTGHCGRRIRIARRPTVRGGPLRGRREGRVCSRSDARSTRESRAPIRSACRR